MTQMQAEPKDGFEGFQLDRALLRAIAEAGFSEARPIQTAAIPSVLDGRDVLGLAQTGTGKTAAFALPILQRMLRGARRGPSALVIAPTRELIQQIDAEFHMLGKHAGLRTVTIFGGVSPRPQIEALRRRPHVILACPGRFLDLYSQRHLELDGIETLVLDEADHMFDMGFLPDIKRIIATLPRKRQNLLFSATMPPEIRGLADNVLRDPLVVELSTLAPAETIAHAIYPVEETAKLDSLAHLLGADDFVSAIVFCRTKYRAKRLALKLAKCGHRAVALQGNMSQSQRDRAMEGFRRRDYDVLVATDVAARGIDVAKVSHVINYDVPNTPDAYTHRIGRTGRAERDGQAFTFVTREDREMVRAIERRIGFALPRRRLDGVEMAVELPVELAPERPTEPRTDRPGDTRTAPPPRRRRRRPVARDAVQPAQRDPAPAAAPGGARRRRSRPPGR